MIEINNQVLDLITGEYGILEVIDSASIFELPKESLLKIKEVMFYWLYPKETNRHMKRPSGEKISMFLLKKKSGEREKTDIVDIRNDIWIFLWRKNACTGSVAGRQISLIMW